MRYIELFAGCGGLSLGLESAGYELCFANELSPMASETFAYNILNEDFEHIAQSSNFELKKALWISSQYPKEELNRRLRENPQQYPDLKEGYSDLPTKLKELEGKLLIGSIIQLNKYLDSNKSLEREIREADIDLVSGGPPCQSFSLAGMRQLDNARNTLPMDFAEFVGRTKPKVALLENVSGILRAFNTGGRKYYAWFEVAKAFVSKGYYPICLHINAKYAGAAQNRPRFILVALRKDIFEGLLKANESLEPDIKELLKESKSFFVKESKNIVTQPYIDLNYYDIEKDNKLFRSALFSPFLKHKGSELFNVKDAIDDLRENRGKRSASKYSEYLDKQLKKLRNSKLAKKEIANSKLRKASPIPTMRFRLYQILSIAAGNGLKAVEKETVKYLKTQANEFISDSTIAYLMKQNLLDSDGKTLANFSKKSQVLKYLSTLATKKQTQRALIANKPAPAALSIPDDACHYDIRLPRTLTIREMARFQSFPDWFVFRSKETTGGQMRKFEVPQYTQIGNAVPPLLGKSLGEVVENIMRISQD